MKESWKQYNGAIIPTDPPHINVKESRKNITSRIIKTRSYFARWVENFDKSKQKNFWYVICDKQYNLEDYSVNTRSKIRRALKKNSVKKIKKEILITDGYDVYINAVKRYKTLARPMKRAEFENSIKVLNSRYEFWGVNLNENGKLVAYAIVDPLKGHCNYSVIKFNSDYLKFYTSYALYFVMNKYYLSLSNLKYVSEGARSILHNTNVENFLVEKFYFRRAYCDLKIIYHPLIKLIIKLIYPFRFLLSKIEINFFHKVYVVLKQHEIFRNER